MALAPLAEQQYQYYCVQHPGKFAAWCADHVHQLQQAAQQHKHHFFPIGDMERLHNMLGLLDNQFVWWGAIAVGAYFVGRIGLPALYADITSLVSKVTGLFHGSTSTTGSTPTATAPAPAPTGTA